MVSTTVEVDRPVREKRRPLLGVVPIVVLALLAVALVMARDLPWTEQRVANRTVRFPLSPPSATNWTTENAYPHLRFFEPTCVVFARDGSHRVFVLERRGTVVSFIDDPQTGSTEQVLDISSHVSRTPYEDDGAIALALHPEFGVEGSPHRNYFYVLYTAKIGEKCYDRLSRFTLTEQGAGEEAVLIDQLDENLWHNGGALTFGPDGFLYVGRGDEGTNGDGLGNGQRLDRDLYCGILRIDVDCRGDDISHPPIRQPETGTTAHYFVPNDNPFVGLPDVLEEFWAHGLRNPFRAAFDGETGALWVTDVGHLRREEVNLIEKGGNYGWSYLEGSLPFDESYLKGVRPDPYQGTEQAPVWEYPHLNGDNCVIGGLVYRGSKHPALQGKFIYADNGSGRVWALSRDAHDVVVNRELLSLPVSSKTGIASIQPDADGEPLVVILGESGTTSGTIRRIVAAAPGTAASLPIRLSETGLFTDLSALTPGSGVIPYEVNAPQAAADARIRRWIVLPGDGTDPDPQIDRIARGASGDWRFPTGSLFVQHFDLRSADERWQPVETRVLVRHQEQGVYGLTYRWNQDGTDARLLDDAQTASWSSRDGAGIERGHRWHFLDRQTCIACHNQNAGFVLGVNGRQLNREIAKRTLLGSAQQLTAWSQAGMFQQPCTPDEVAALPRLVDPHDEQADLNLRARSYLDVNCASCHRAGGARANFLARFDDTGSLAALFTKPKQSDFGIEGARIVAANDPFRSVLYYRMAKLGQGRMPFVGSAELDSKGLQLLRRWIEQLPADANVDPRVEQKRAEQTELLRRLIASGTDSTERANLAGDLLHDTRGALQLWQAMQDGQVAEPLRESIVSLATQAESGATRDLFEWYVPPADRTQRLGTQFDLSEVLRLSGDPERGRRLYAEHEALACRNCHQVLPSARSIGPSLHGIGAKMTRSELLYHIVHPSERIDPKFATWVVETVDGKVLSGVIVDRTDGLLTVVDANGKEQQIPESEVDYLEPSSQSMMPAHLLQSLTAAEAADLLQYLRSLSPAPHLY